MEGVTRLIFLLLSHAATTIVAYSINDTIISTERRLIYELKHRYEALGKIARPRTNASEPVKVWFGLRLVHLELDPGQQVMTTSNWIRMRWFDEHVVWSPEDFDGIKHITLPAHALWTPDIALVNTAGGLLMEQPSDLQVKYNGRVFWAVQRKYSSACLIDVTDYPHDRHTCDMWFQSLANYFWNLHLLPYYKSPFDLDTLLSSYNHTQEWAILSNTSIHCDRPRKMGMILMYSNRRSLKFSLTLQRRAGFRAVLFFVPCVMLSFLIPVIFCLPSQRPDRMNLAMSLYSSLTFMLFMVNGSVPSMAAFVPRITIYYCVTLISLILASCLSVTVVIVNSNGESRTRVPKLVHWICISWLGRLLCLKSCVQHLNDVKSLSKPRSDHQKVEEPRISTDWLTTAKSIPEVDWSKYNPYPAILGEDPERSSGEKQREKCEDRNCEMLRDISVEDSVPVDSQLDSSILAPGIIQLEWSTLARILDRLFFVAFLVLDVINLIIFHPKYIAYAENYHH